MRRNTKKNSIKNYIYAGAMVIAPVCVTVWFIVKVTEFFDALVAHFVPAKWLVPMCFPGYGLFYSLAFFLLVGFIARTFLGSKIVEFGDSLVARLPVIGAVYATGQKIIQAIVPHGQEDLKKVALLEYPSEGMWCLCFVTGAAPSKAQDTLDKEKNMVSVFIPTAPNPTSGILLVVPMEKLIILDMPADEGMRFIVTAGMGDNEGKG